MGEVKMRKTLPPNLKAAIGIEAIRGAKTIQQIAQEYGVHPVQVSQYKKLILEQASKLFAGKRGPRPRSERGEQQPPYSEVSAPPHNGMHGTA